MTARRSTPKCEPEVEREGDLPEVLPELPIFPLSNCVLLPGGLLPLHVFEPRFIALARAALAGDHLLAIARLLPGFEADYNARPPVHPYAGVGRIICSEELPDGRFMLLLRGEGRVIIESENPPTQTYRTVSARVLHDALTPDPERFAAAHTRLMSMCDKLSQALEECGDKGGSQLRELARCASAPGQCADAVAAAIIMDVAERQRLLENLCPEARLHATIEAVSQMLCAIAPCDGELN